MNKIDITGVRNPGYISTEKNDQTHKKHKAIMVSQGNSNEPFIVPKMLKMKCGMW
jgi:hypothetical protein